MDLEGQAVDPRCGQIPARARPSTPHHTSPDHVRAGVNRVSVTSVDIWLNCMVMSRHSENKSAGTHRTSRFGYHFHGGQQPASPVCEFVRYIGGGLLLPVEGVKQGQRLLQAARQSARFRQRNQARRTGDENPSPTRLTASTDAATALSKTDQQRSAIADRGERSSPISIRFCNLQD